MNHYSLIQIFLYIIAAILAVIAIFNKPKNTEKVIAKYDKIFLVGIILTLGFSILLEVLKADEEKEKSSEKEKEYIQQIAYLDTLIQKSDSTLIRIDSTLKTQHKLQTASDSIIELNGDLLTKSQRQIALQDEIINNITGGDSYPHIDWHENNNSSDFFLKLSNPGKFPLTDLRVCITYKDIYVNYPRDIKYDLGFLHMNVPGAFNWSESYGRLNKKRFGLVEEVKFEVFAPGQEHIFTIPFSTNRYLNYNIYCSSNKRGWVTLLRIARNNEIKSNSSTLIFAIRSLRIEKGKNIQLFIKKPLPPYKNFRLDNKGDIKW